MGRPISTAERYWRWRIFAITWVAYAGFYLCRKNFTVVMPKLHEQLNYSKEDLAWAITGFSLVYMLGQFINGLFSDRFGPRLVVSIGLIGAALANLGMGLSAQLLLFFGLLNIFNGYFQSTGWSGTVKNMSSWFRRDERGVVMAWWGTCYALGGVIATSFATYMAFQAPFLPEIGWRRGFFIPALVLLVIGVLYALFTRNRPADVALEDYSDEPVPGTNPSSDVAEESAQAVWRAVLSLPAVWVTGAMYFLLKFVRYAFLYWLPLFLVESLHYTDQRAGYTSGVYELAGFAGVVLAGYASDKLMGSRRFPVACVMLAGLAVSCLLYPTLAPMGATANILGICLIGIMTFGPDALMSGAAAMDMGSQRAAGTASGFINGMGSAGQALSAPVVAYVSASSLGWNGVFYLFVVMSLGAAALMAFKWNDGREPA